MCDQVLHGYAWMEDERRFVLHAQFPGKRKDIGHQEEGDGSQHRQETQEKGEVALISIPSHLPGWLANVSHIIVL